ncbi:unnamed protein product [Sphenostylis stenocarpa]|uniref:Uncharacterized protein n=1 Tax=Sphenostylis stenocarpa TaxID=92480 RepID=A0AA86S0I6_9FABA|nr:unnamed protein product [Sphenostylis stenocarpa]
MEAKMEPNNTDLMNPLSQNWVPVSTITRQNSDGDRDIDDRKNNYGCDKIGETDRQ